MSTTQSSSAGAATVDAVAKLSTELSLAPRAVTAAIKLLTDGNTVPFIARYRKEVTGGLDEVQIRAIEERRAYLAELDARRSSILGTLAEQGTLTPELQAALNKAATKAELEDLYLPYKPKRRTRATIAREKGLESLAEQILAQPSAGDPVQDAERFVNDEHGVLDTTQALAGARDIVAEVIAETPEVRALVRATYLNEGVMTSEVMPAKAKERTKFEQYYAFRESLKTIPSYRYLAIRRGEREGVLRSTIEVDDEGLHRRIERHMQLDRGSPYAHQLAEAAADSYKRLLAPSVENDVRVEVKMRADREAVDVFASNLRNLLLAPPLGSEGIVGIDPGLRTGCKCAAVDATGTFRDTVTLYLTKGDKALEQAKTDFIAFLQKHRPVAIAVGNGTGGRETTAFVKKVLKDAGISSHVLQVNESGASVYSASDVARNEFPDLDLTIRGAISIARRLQDPLAELVKIEPKAIGVGQYQHDVHQPLLGKKLGDVVESCVNHVGVELNTASAFLLSYVAGIGPATAKKIVAHRDAEGPFGARASLLSVSGIGPKAFEQAAGFLRIRDAAHPLDASAVHPERYSLVEQMARDLEVEVAQLVGNASLVSKIEVGRYVGEGIGEPTLQDILDELKKPGRDPRNRFEMPQFRDDVQTLEDLKDGMVLEGVVTNVTAFGAFVDLGVHQDGLVHVSQLADRFVKDPNEVVKVGDTLKVRVLEVDRERRRISLSARSENSRASESGRRNDKRGPATAKPSRDSGRGRGNKGTGGRGKGSDKRKTGKDGFSNNPFAELARFKLN